MSELLVQERAIVTPGESLAVGMDFLPGENTYRENEKIYSKVLGLVNISGRVIKITALSGPYVLQTGDKIIGKVIDIAFSGWRINTNTAYSAMLNVKDATSRFIRKEEDLSKILAIGDYVVVKIINVTSQNLIDLTMKEPGLHKIFGGRIININSQKVPRVIGKKGSMVSLVKDKTGCDITVGQNGLIWLKGTPEGEYLAEQAIKMIETRSHQEGLTEKMEKFLDEQASVLHIPKRPTSSVTESTESTQGYEKFQERDN
ncbi:MAG: exosome complex RNA-binding protein Rrp4 [Nanoarchaeota archaeon]